MSQEKVVIWWEEEAVGEGWHVDLLRSDGSARYELLLTSGSPDFPVNVHQYGPLEEDMLIQSLKGVFPDAEISLKF